MENLAPSSSLFCSANNGDGNENKILPSSAAESPTTSATGRISNVSTILISSSVFCLVIRWGLPRLIRRLLNSNSNPPSTLPQTQNVADPTPGRPYHVFLNHRGPDVKKSLASSIYHWFEEKGLRVFLDKEEFQAGEGLRPTIQQAIGSASVHVAIFSKRYAESSWCLDELCWMLKSGANIIPVFYDVRPFDLRWIGKGKGVYKGAFSKHKRKYRVPSQKLDEWKAALQDVSHLHGFELNGPEFNGDLGKLLKSIGNAVSEAVAEKMPLESAKDPVGLDEAIEDFQHFMQREVQRRDEDPVKIVGIVGLGGTGKTTLAKQFYNIWRASFTASSFLSEVRHTALQNLQDQLLFDLFHCSDDKSERFGAREILTNKLRSSTTRVLVILDDIDHETQIENLLHREVLGSGSLILLTSRDEMALTKSGADSIYKIKLLKSNYALELFCRHAFRQPCPKTGFEDLARIFCDKCGGVPLFLKVMGGHLRVIGGDDKDVWHEELEIIPDDIQNLLKTSYDALSIEEKQMFLDVACFFLGENKAMAIRVWKVSDKRASTHLKNIEWKCLVEVDDENRLKLHDHLRDFGRQIAKHESPCRFWHPRQIINIREELQGRREVRGIIAAHAEDSHDSRLNSTLDEIDLPRLKFLAVKGDCFESRFEQEATNLIWFRWCNCPHTNIPSWWISMKNLTVLHIDGGYLEKWEVCDAELSLKEVAIRTTRLSYVSIDEDTCPLLEHLDLSNNWRLVEVEHLPTTLVSLHLSECTSLKKMSASSHLKKLKFLDIGSSWELQELPDLKHLTLLETLQAKGCSNLQNIQGLEYLSKLRDLDIRWCSQLRELPNLSGLTSLGRLQLRGCNKLQNIQGLEHLSQLRDLDFGQCSELGELPNLSCLTSLETLGAQCCRKLQNIQGLEHLTRLRSLDVRWCFELGELPNLSGLTSLETLGAQCCRKLQNIQGLEHLSQLTSLDFGQCSDLGELPNLSGLTSLETLGVQCCSKLQNLQGLEHLSKLTDLDVRRCSELHELPHLSGLTSLVTLQTRSCSKLQNIQGLEHLSKLRDLNVSQCSEIGELPNLSDLTSLENLEVLGCSKLQNIQGLEHLSKLRDLDVSQCSEIGELPNLSSLTSLENLEALGCSKLQNIQGLEHLSRLRNLDVGGCSELGELPNLSDLTTLVTFRAQGCTKLQTIQGLEHLSKLRDLDISECSQLRELPILSGLTSLNILRAWSCSKLQNIQGLEQLSELRHLEVSHCSLVGELPNLSGLTSLETLQAQGCSKLQYIQCMGYLSKLTDLNVSQCSELRELPNISSLTSLEKLRAQGCNKLRIIQGLEHLSELKYLDVNWCSELCELPHLSGLASLETLRAHGCKLQCIQGLEHLSKLRYLDVGSCSDLGELPNLSALTSLETLDASGCSKLQNIQGLEHLSKLRYLDVRWCSELRELPNLSDLTSLETLRVKGCSKLQNMQSLEHLSKLRDLEVS